MGQASLAADPARLVTILGSCVAATLYAPRRRLGMLSHVVLPQSRGNNENPAKYADTAIPHMLETLRREGITAGELIAKVAGGACMFADGQFSCIGENNAEAVFRALDAAGVRTAASDTGGKNGRRVCFDLSTGDLIVASVGRPSRILCKHKGTDNV